MPEPVVGAWLITMALLFLVTVARGLIWLRNKIFHPRRAKRVDARDLLE